MSPTRNRRRPRGNLVAADGCPAGWLVVTMNADGAVVAEVLDTASLLARLPGTRVLAIDLPIGLNECGPRDCDVAARRELGRHGGSSVFPAPVRAALAGADYADACRRSAEVSGKRLSRQTWGIVGRIRDVDRALRRAGSHRGRVFEVHPELSFRRWRGSPMPAGKKTAAGLRARRRLTDARFPGIFASARADFPKRAVRDDDIVDALACLWTAERIAAGTATTLPVRPPRDRHGLAMRIVT
ncbi:MAG: DUF429 domain-containing protein [Gemmatimonadetes bacterium]|nr:DUF429 domain-containing protein [Gemmatimonadota bacterium]